MANMSERKMMRCSPDITSSWYRRLVSCCAVFVICNLMLVQTAVAQQAYYNQSGYVCQSAQGPGSASSCDTYTMWRCPSNTTTIKSVAELFNVSASTVANLSSINLTTSSNCNQGQPLYIPLQCKCVSGGYQALVTYIVQEGDIYESISNSTFEGLTTWQEITAANPGQDPSTLANGQPIDIPLQCACPSANQLRNGTKFLLSYLVFPEDTLDAIYNYFHVPIPDLIAANLLNGVTAVLYAFSTFLVPLSQLTPLDSIRLIHIIPDPGLPPSPAVTISNITTQVPTTTTYTKRSNTPLFIGVAIGVFGFVLAAILTAQLAAVESRRHRRLKDQTEIDSPGMLKQHHGVFDHMLSHRSDFLDGMSTVVDGDKPIIFTYEELRAATNDFNADSRLQGSVFCGKLNGTVVAIKQMKGNMAQEIRILSQIHHMNVVKLLGVCVNDAEHLFMVFEYAENGSLSDCLHSQVAHPTSNYSRSTGLLAWTTRVHIGLDIASGLEYIHNYTNPSFVHKDVKSSNILLDGDWHAKVANFGMAKSANSLIPGPILTNHIVGTQGYMAPEYLEHGLVTTKADVYSFGVVLLELITGEEAIVQAREDDAFGDQFKGWTLASAISTILKDKKDNDKKTELQNWIDPRLQDAYPIDIALDIAKLAISCVDSDLTLRPAMKEITFSLSHIVTASLQWEATTLRKNQMPGVVSIGR